MSSDATFKVKTQNVCFWQHVPVKQQFRGLLYWLVLTANWTHSKVTWEKSHNEEFLASGSPVGMYVENVFILMRHYLDQLVCRPVCGRMS